MVDVRDMPPDPFADDGVDLMALEHAEELARRGADPASTVWERFDGPTTDDFDDAGREIADMAGEPEPGSSRELPFALWKAAVASVCVVLIIAIVALYAR